MLNSICLFVFVEVLKKMSHIAEMSSFSEIKIERYCSQTYSHFFLQYPFFLWLIYNLTFIHRQHAIWIAFTVFLVLNFVFSLPCGHCIKEMQWFCVNNIHFRMASGRGNLLKHIIYVQFWQLNACVCNIWRNAICS